MRACLTGLVLPPFAALACAVPAAAQDEPAGSGRAVVQQLPASETMNLNAALVRLGRNPRDVAALIDAGKAALAIGDVDAATGFFSRADAVSPGNPQVKAGLACAMVRNGNPFGAIPLFDEAARAGITDPKVMIDRGLAYDLVGDNAAAQRIYREALARGPDDEASRRLAISLAISGDRRGAGAALSQQLVRQDMAAWRARAFSLAIMGQTDEAIQVVNSTLPAGLAAGIAPYLRYMPRLTPAQQAAAANFGQFPRASEIGVDDPRVAAFATTAPRRPAVASGPDAGLIPRGEPLGRNPRARDERDARRERERQRELDRRRPPEVAVARAAPLPAPAPAPAPAPTVAAAAPRQAVPAAPVASAPGPATPLAGAVLPQPASRPPVAAAPAPPVRVAAAPTPAPAPAPTPAVAPLPPARATVAAAPQPSPPPPPAPAPTVVTVPTPAPGGTPTLTPAPASPAASVAVARGGAPVPPTPRRQSLAEAFSDLASPVEVTRASGAVDIRRIRPARETAPGAAAPAAPVHPSRIWVQVATGRDKAALGFDWRRMARQAEAPFRNRRPWVSSWGQTNRLLAGPFDSEAAANTFIAQLRRADIDGAFVWTSPAGQVVDALGGR